MDATVSMPSKRRAKKMGEKDTKLNGAGRPFELSRADQLPELVKLLRTVDPKTSLSGLAIIGGKNPTAVGRWVREPMKVELGNWVEFRNRVIDYSMQKGLDVVPGVI